MTNKLKSTDSVKSTVLGFNSNYDPSALGKIIINWIMFSDLEYEDHVLEITLNRSSAPVTLTRKDIVNLMDAVNQLCQENQSKDFTVLM